MDNFPILLGESLGIIHVPAKLREQGIHKVDAKLGFVVIRRADLIQLHVEMVDEALDGIGTCPHVGEANRGCAQRQMGGSAPPKILQDFSCKDASLGYNSGHEMPVESARYDGKSGGNRPHVTECYTMLRKHPPPVAPDVHPVPPSSLQNLVSGKVQLWLAVQKNV
ncbi:MAG: hypothetical protein ABSG31_02605 [Tepidisphaeraceae bacterium]